MEEINETCYSQGEREASNVAVSAERLGAQGKVAVCFPLQGTWGRRSQIRKQAQWRHLYPQSIQIISLKLFPKWMTRPQATSLVYFYVFSAALFEVGELVCVCAHTAIWVKTGEQIFGPLGPCV